jgi:hypothetical protein
VAPKRCSSWVDALSEEGEYEGAGCETEPRGADWRSGSGGGVAGTRGTTLGRAASVAADAGGGVGMGAGGGAALGGTDVKTPGGWRSGGGGGTDRKAPAAPGTTPRDEGGGGMRDDSNTPPPAGRGTTLTGRGATLTGASGAAEEPWSGVVALGSFSSPIRDFAAQAHRTAPTTLTRTPVFAHDFVVQLAER